MESYHSVRCVSLYIRDIIIPYSLSKNISLSPSLRLFRPFFWYNNWMLNRSKFIEINLCVKHVPLKCIQSENQIVDHISIWFNICSLLNCINKSLLFECWQRAFSNGNDFFSLRIFKLHSNSTAFHSISKYERDSIEMQC